MTIYYITGIKKKTSNNHTYISEVMLHMVEENTIKCGVLKDKDSVIALIKNAQTISIYTATWNYNNASWTKREKVSYETINGKEYLRSNRDQQQIDNLLHLLPLANLSL